jgi:hypothetical protein
MASISRYKSIFIYCVFLGISYLMASRDLGVSKDDFAYLNHFMGERNTFEYGNLSWFLSDPLWSAYTSNIGFWLGEEIGYRITIFLSTFLYLFFAFKFTRSFTFTLSLFFLTFELIAQLFFNQIRQGFAISILLSSFYLNSIGKRKFSFAILLIAPFIHFSSFIIVVLYFLSTQKRFVFWNTFSKNLNLILLLILIFFINKYINIDNFFQEKNYELIRQSFTLNFYILITFYFYLFLNSNSDNRYDKKTFLIYLGIFFYFMLYFFASFAGRYLYFVIGFAPLFFNNFVNSSKQRRIFVLWLVIHSGLNLILSFNSEDNYISRITLLLS